MFKGSEAGTALNAIMARLTQTTGPAATALEDMGISAYDSEGNFRGMEVVMKEVESAMGDMTDAEKAHATTQLAGLNHGKTFTAMLNGLGDEYDELKDDIVNSDGALKEMRDTMKDNLQGSLESMTSALGEVGLVIGNALIPFIKDAAEWIEEWANRFGDLDEGTQQTIIKIGVFIAAIGPLLVAFGTIAGSITKVIAVGKMLVTAWGVLTGAGSALAGGLAATLGVIFSPAGLIIAGIAAAIAIGVSLYKNWDTIQVRAGELLSSLSARFASIRDAITKPVASARDTVSGIVDKITGFFSNMKLRIPKISMPKLPRFSMTGKFGFQPPSVPRLGVKWNADGAIFNKPTIFDTPQGMQGVGEAGAEAVLPIEKLSGIMAKTMSDLGYGNDRGSSGAGTYNIEVNNPVAERSSDSIRKTLLKQSYGMGGG